MDISRAKYDTRNGTRPTPACHTTECKMSTPVVCNQQLIWIRTVLKSTEKSGTLTNYTAQHTRTATGPLPVHQFLTFSTLYSLLLMTHHKNFVRELFVWRASRHFHTVSAKERGRIKTGRCFNKPNNFWGAVSKFRHQSHSAGCFRPLGRDEDILPIHDELGRSQE